jgi:hypothetical protein
MTTIIDLENTLPLRAPTPAHPLLGSKKGVGYLVYPLVELTEKGRDELLATLHEDDIGPHACRLVERL